MLETTYVAFLGESHMKYCNEILQEDWSFYDLRSQLRDSIFRRMEDVSADGDRKRDALRSPEDVKRRQEEVRERFIDCLGGLPERNPSLCAKTVGLLQEDGFRIEKVLFQARPGAWITANFYLPEQRNGKIPAILLLCGHAEEGKAYPQYQNVCRRLVQAGIAVLAQDPVGQGERFEYYIPETGELRIKGLIEEHDYEGKPIWALGQSLARYFVADAIGGIDYLCSREEVDPKRIGVTGNSGGGTQTSMLLLADRRISAAAIGTFITSEKAILRSGNPQDAEQIWPGLSRFGIDHEDILLAAAPRPVMVLGVEYDFFPMDGTVCTVERARRYWDVLGNPGWPQLVTDRCEHEYSDLLARKAAAFFAETFGLPKPCGDAPQKVLPRENLNCTSCGQLLQDYPDAVTVRQSSASVAEAFWQQRQLKDPLHRRDESSTWLRKQIFRDRKPGRLYLRCVDEQVEDGLCCSKCLWAAEEDRVTSAAVFRDIRFDGQQLPVTIAVWDDGTRAACRHEDWIRQTCRQGRMVLVIDAAGIGASRPFPICGYSLQEQFGTLYILGSKLIRMGDSLCALRCYDVLRAVEAAALLENVLPGDVRLEGWGDGSVYVRIAGFLAGIPASVRECPPTFTEVVQADAYDDRTFAEIVLPGILQHFDLDDLDQWIGCGNNVI